MTGAIETVRRKRRMLAAALTLGYLLRKIGRARRRLSLRGRSVVIAGGSRGLGLAIARHMLAQGAHVALLARDADELTRASGLLEDAYPAAHVLTAICDVSDPEQVAAAMSSVVQARGGIDVLVNVAGVIQVGPWEHMRDEDFREALDVHVWGQLNCVRAVVPHMRRSGEGRIVNVTSVGALMGVPHMLPYVVSKGAALRLSDGLRTELAVHGIKVTSVVPGLLRTGSPVRAWFKGRQSEEFTWFAIADALPGLSMSATRAARRIVAACRHGDAHVVLGWPARLAELATGVAPQLVAALLTLANRFLPPATDQTGDDKWPGMAVPSRWAPSLLTRLSDRVVPSLNQLTADGQAQYRARSSETREEAK